MFYHDIPWFCQHFKSENSCFLNLYSVHATRIGPVTKGHVKSSQMRTPKHLYNS